MTGQSSADFIWIIFFLTAVMAAVGAWIEGQMPHTHKLTAVPSSDAGLFRWTPQDPFTVRDLLNGGVAIFGRAGSGKTSSSGKLLGSSIIRNRQSGGLILAAKPEDLAMWRDIFSKAGRSADLRVFSPKEKLRFNFLDYEMQHGGHTRNITQCIRTIGESLGSTDVKKGGGDQGKFWEEQTERCLYNAVEAIKQGTGSVSGPFLQRFIVDAAMKPEQIHNEEWKKGIHCTCLEAGHRRQKSRVEAHDFQLTTDYWLSEFPKMADRTRSVILASVLGLLHVFNTGIVRELVSSETNITPDDMFKNQWVIVDMSPTEWGELGSFVCAGWKFLTQRRVLRREAVEGDSFNVIWADEAQQFVNSFDAQYIAQCRSHRGCMVFLSQSIPGYYASLGSDKGEHRTMALLSNFAHAIIHASDAETAEWAARKLGKKREILYSGSVAPAHDTYDAVFGQQQVTGSFGEHYEDVLQPSVFMNGLRTGGKANGFITDAIVIKSGEPFSSGENWLHRTFTQE